MANFFNSFVGNLGQLIIDFFNGLIVGVFSFVDGLLTSLDNLDGLITHATSSITNFVSGVLTIGNNLFPFIPAEWMAFIEAGLLILAIGLIVRKKVVG